MASSSRIIDYMGYGVAASLPATPPVGTGVTAFYYETDTTTLKVWNGSAWVSVTSSGSGITTIDGQGGSTTTASPAGLSTTVYNVPASSGFAFVNQNSATLTNYTNGPLVWQCPSANPGGTLGGITTPSPGSGAWTYTTNVNLGALGNNSNSQMHVCGTSDGTKYESLVLSTDGALRLMQWNTSTSFNATQENIAWTFGLGPKWFRVNWVPGTTTITYSYSIDGFNWVVFYTTSSPFLTPTKFWAGANLVNNAALQPLTISFNYLVQS